MPTKEEIVTSLEAVQVPAVKRSIVNMNLVREISTSNSKVSIKLASTGLIPGAQEWIKTKAQEAVEKMPEVSEAEVEYTDAKAKDLTTGGMTKGMSIPWHPGAARFWKEAGLLK